jgi:hypothetical protein
MGREGTGGEGRKGGRERERERGERETKREGREAGELAPLNIKT